MIKKAWMVAFAAVAVAACLFPSLDDLSGAVDASTDVAAIDHAAVDAGDGGSARCVDTIPNLIAHWPADEGSGTTVSDCSGQFPGVMTDDVTWVQDGNGTGLNFPDKGLVAVAPNAAFHVGDFTATAEVRATSVNIPSYLGQIVGSNGSWGMYLVQNLGFAMTIYDPAGNDLGWLPPIGSLPFDDGGLAPPAPWIPVAAVLRNGTQREVWVNGSMVNSDMVEAGAFSSPTEPEICFGAYEGSYQRLLVGQMRNVRLFSRALTKEELQSLANP